MWIKISIVIVALYTFSMMTATGQRLTDCEIKMPAMEAAVRALQLQRDAVIGELNQKRARVIELEATK